MYDTSLQSLDDAIAQHQARTIQLTESQANAINAQIDSINTHVSELGEQGQTQTSVTQTNLVATHRSMANTISMLLRLPANIQNQANVGAASEAYYDYLTASPENKAAAYDKAVKLLRESINAALESPSLDAGTRAALEGLLGEIDNNSGNSTANMIKLNEKIARKAEAVGIIKDELAACIEFYEHANGQFKDIDTAIQAFKHLTNGEFEEFAEMVDVSSPYGKAFFWSGDQVAAEVQAEAANGVTLEMTPGGDLVNGWSWLKNKFPTWDDGVPTDIRPLWKALSRKYALGVQGEVTYVHPKGYYGKM